MVKVGLRAARDKEEDLDDIIWLFKKFHNTTLFSEAFGLWANANKLSEELTLLGREVRNSIIASNLTEVEKTTLLQKIEIISEKFTIVERNFTDAMVKGSWKTKSYLIFANVFFILIIISCVGLYFSLTMKKLLESAKEIKLKNDNLIVANQELDRFVYSTSHDLRSPLTSLKGLVQIAKDEEDVKQIRYYFDLMEETINKQDRFIIDIIDYSRNKRTDKSLEIIDLNQLIDDSLQQNNYSENVKNLKIEKHKGIS